MIGKMHRWNSLVRTEYEIFPSRYCAAMTECVCYYRVLDLACSDTQSHVQECALSTLHEMTHRKPLLHELIRNKAISRLSQISSTFLSKSGNMTARSASGGGISSRSAYSSVSGVRTNHSVAYQCAVLVKQLQEASGTWSRFSLFFWGQQQYYPASS